MQNSALGMYRLAARLLLPRAFREEYGAEMEDAVAARFAETGGALGIIVAFTAELADLTATAAREWKAALTTIKEGVMGGGWGEIATSARNLTRRPGLSLGVVLTIGLGIGATTTIFGVVDGVILRPLPYQDPEGLVAIGGLARSGPPDPETGLQPLVDMNAPVYTRYHDRARSFTQMAGLDPYMLQLTDEGGVEREVPGVRVSPEFFELFGVAPVLGRTFALEEHTITDEAAVAMIAYEYWQSRYGGDPDVLGRAIETTAAAGPRATIIGVLPRGFRPPEAFEQSGARPMIYGPLPTVDPGPGRIVIFPVNGVGRLRPGTTVEQAREEAASLFQEIENELANLPRPPGAQATGIGVNDLHMQTVGTTERTLWIFLGAAALLLALTAMNAATLFLSRALDRTQELGVRVALGAGRAGVVRLLLAEAGALALVGGVLGVAFAYGGVATFLRFAPTSIPRLSSVTVDARVLAAAAVMTLGTALAAGLLPALRFTAKAPWQRLQSGRGASDSTTRLRTVLVGGQLALAVVLLSGAGLLFSSFLRLRSMDPGFEPDGLLVVATAPRGPVRIRITDPSQMTRMGAEPWDRVREALLSTPGVTAAALANALPFQPPTWAPRITLPGDGPEVVREGIHGYVISPGYLEAVGTEVTGGRGFDARDGFEGEMVALVNEAFVRTQLDGADPLGAIIGRGREGPGGQGQTTSMRIVGVVENVVQARVEDGALPAVYIPYQQADFPQLGNFWSVVRAGTTPETLAPELQAALASTDRTPRVVETMETRMSATRATPRFQTFLIGAFAAVAMLLAAAGLQGSLAHSVRRRQRELGVRMALGADRSSVLKMVLTQGLRVSVVGLAVGIAGTLALSRVLASFLYDMAPWDPMTLVGVAAVLIAVSVVACLAPARRATAVDPVRVLQAE